MNHSGVAVLFCREDSIYKDLGADCYDVRRDARTFTGGKPVIAHPPCRAWGRLRRFARPDDGEMELAVWAVSQVRKEGGVLEHPCCSLLWPAAQLPPPGDKDDYGGRTITVPQWWWGHRADKPTLLYISGISPRDWPPIPMRLGTPTHVVQSRKRIGHRPHITKSEREQTPIDFARWLLILAGRALALPPKEAV